MEDDRSFGHKITACQLDAALPDAVIRAPDHVEIGEGEFPDVSGSRSGTNE
jgi:hypothetical protein